MKTQLTDWIFNGAHEHKAGIEYLDNDANFLDSEASRYEGKGDSFMANICTSNAAHSRSCADKLRAALA